VSGFDAAAPSAGGAAEVRAALARQVDAWNRGDLDAFCAPYADDATYLAGGRRVVGRAALRARYAERYPDGPGVGGALTLEVAALDEAPARVTVVARWAIAGAAPASGWALLVFALRDGAWWLTHDATT
jgi:uncharacterized protein (TIGR02246 family)